MSGVEQREAVRGILREPTIPEILKYRRVDGEFLGSLTNRGGMVNCPTTDSGVPSTGWSIATPRVTRARGYDEALLCPYCG